MAVCHAAVCWQQHALIHAIISSTRTAVRPIDVASAGHLPEASQQTHRTTQLLLCWTSGKLWCAGTASEPSGSIYCEYDDNSHQCCCWFSLSRKCLRNLSYLLHAMKRQTGVPCSNAASAACNSDNHSQPHRHAAYQKRPSQALCTILSDTLQHSTAQRRKLYLHNQAQWCLAVVVWKNPTLNPFAAPQKILHVPSLCNKSATAEARVHSATPQCLLHTCSINCTGAKMPPQGGLSSHCLLVSIST